MCGCWCRLHQDCTPAGLHGSASVSHPESGCRSLLSICSAFSCPLHAWVAANGDSSPQRSFLLSSGASRFLPAALLPEAVSSSLHCPPNRVPGSTPPLSRKPGGPPCLLFFLPSCTVIQVSITSPQNNFETHSALCLCWSPSPHLHPSYKSTRILSSSKIPPEPTTCQASC